MIDSNKFYFNKKYSDNLDVYLSKYPTVEPLQLRNRVENIKGIDGSLYIKEENYKDRSIKLECIIRNNLDIDSKLDAILEWLTEIEDNRLFLDNSNKFYVVKDLIIGNITKDLFADVPLTLDLVVEPFRLGDKIEIETTNKIIDINNNCSFKLKPVIEVFGNGIIEIISNNEILRIENVVEKVLIDSTKKMIIDKDGLSMDYHSIGNFPVFNKGRSKIEIIGNVTKVKIDCYKKYR